MIPNGHDSVISAVIKDHKSRIREANRALVNTCCSQRHACIHHYVTSIICSNTPMVFTSVTYPWTSPTDNINAVDGCGNNLLFVLDPKGFVDHDQPTKLFSDLINMLLERGFNFGHLDHNGRSFLSLLCITLAFQIEWVNYLFAFFVQFRNVAQSRDSSGLQLIDYLSRHPDVHRLTKDVVPHLSPGASTFQDSNQEQRSKLLPDEDVYGRTFLHDFVRRDFILQPYAVLNLHDLQDINRYDLY
ncbi:hypothetical protein K469DRAFT_122476 [Zopfia rhizophila CBS 207.26]|uniref:Uncharacterized protein n=1 Tax=Zopfia rhizophila CBS 207.26 TaxID=1314779 RepID=A0A6A6EB43_9PEZI|nr:hypothetical protein K469DRAFT_122476 [Zopfia rhizophila CBS 207.26]